MAIAYVSAACVGNDSVSLPTFQAGDFALVYATSLSGTTVSAPAGWTTVQTNGVNPADVVAYRFLQGGDTSTGTFTNALRTGVVIYRGVNTIEPFDNARTVGRASSTSALSAVDPSAPNPSAPYADSVGVVLLLTNTVNRGANGLTGTGWTNRTSGLSPDYFGVEDEVGANTDPPSYSFTGGTTSFACITVTLRATTTFPFIVDQDTQQNTVIANSTTWTLTYPTNIAAGDLLLIFVATDGTSTPSATGFVIVSGTNQGAVCGAVLAKVAAGSETGTFTLTVASEQGAWLVYRIPAASWYGGTINPANMGSGSDSDGLSAYVVWSGSSANPDAGSVNPANWDVENTLWIGMVAADTSRLVNAFPANYVNGNYQASGGSNGATLGYARRQNAAASEDAGSWTISASDDWVAGTVAVRPAAVAATFAPPFRHHNRLITR